MRASPAGICASKPTASGWMSLTSAIFPSDRLPSEVNDQNCNCPFSPGAKRANSSYLLLPNSQRAESWTTDPPSTREKLRTHCMGPTGEVVLALQVPMRGSKMPSLPRLFFQRVRDLLISLQIY